MNQPVRIALFIDGVNLYASARALGIDIDYRRLLGEFQQKGRLVRAAYYTPVFEEEDGNVSVRPLMDWLGYNGFTVVTKPAKIFVDETGNRTFKGNMDVEIAVDAMAIAEHIDHLYLFSGDGDFRVLVEAVQRKGVRVLVVSTRIPRPPLLADVLRRQADEVVELADVAAKIARNPDRRAESAGSP